MFLAALLFARVWASPSEDVINSLPTFGKPPTPQWSGFLDSSAVENGTMLHYWFAETSGPVSKSTPIILWLNGGPGASSVTGMLEEQGPFLIGDDGVLIANPYSWNRVGHFLILESPAGVGYSFCLAMRTGGDCVNTDKSTARAARAALQDFFVKFPELISNPFYITGESYAGVYVPTLTKEILDNAKEINLVGIAVGDPCTDNKVQEQSFDMLWYGNKYGFLPNDQYKYLTTTCNITLRHPMTKGRWHGLKEQWPPVLVGASPECNAAYYTFLAQTSQGFSQDWVNLWINDYSLYGYVSNTQDDAMAKWMMRNDTMAELHVQGSPVKSWPGPSDGWSYTGDYAACNDNPPKGALSMIDFYKDIVPRLKIAVIYNGDSDPCVSYEGTRDCIAQVGFSVLDAYRPWFFNATGASAAFSATKPLLFDPFGTVADAGVQFGGMIVNYANNLAFMTIHGSGHMVPEFRPRHALHMITKVVQQQPLSPPFASQADLGKMSPSSFNTWLDLWTLNAQAAPYVDND
jgi:cathepsin A (carboxypeptidase C)